MDLIKFTLNIFLWLDFNRFPFHLCITHATSSLVIVVILKLFSVYTHHLFHHHSFDLWIQPWHKCAQNKTISNINHLVLNTATVKWKPVTLCIYSLHSCMWEAKSFIKYHVQLCVMADVCHNHRPKTGRYQLMYWYRIIFFLPNIRVGVGHKNPVWARLWSEQRFSLPQLELAWETCCCESLACIVRRSIVESKNNVVPKRGHIVEAFNTIQIFIKLRCCASIFVIGNSGGVNN